jgi:hypothetical protein
MANYVDLDSLSASTLRHLAALREERDRARYIDYQVMAEERAVMQCAERKPTIGWYQRRLRRPPVVTIPVVAPDLPMPPCVD